MKSEQKLPDGGLVRPTDGVQRPDIVIDLGADDYVEGVRLLDVKVERANEFVTYTVIMVRGKDTLTVTIADWNLTPERAAEKALESYPRFSVYEVQEIHREPARIIK